MKRFDRVLLPGWMSPVLGFALLVVCPAKTAFSFSESIAQLEARHGGRIGVMAVDLEDRRVLAHRNDERFAMCSTFKFLLAAAIAAKVDAGEESWDRAIGYGETDLIPWAPITGKKENLAKGSMSVGDLCEATLTWSDNPAANLLLPAISGPEGLTRYLRAIGDTTTRLDRNEPELNSNQPGDPRDTSTPSAMASSMEKVLFGEALSVASREKILAWLVANRTGDKRIRAAMDPKWKVGDKTGTGENGAANDIAVIWPGKRKPFLLVVFCDVPQATAEQRDALIADTARWVREAWQ